MESTAMLGAWQRLAEQLDRFSSGWTIGVAILLYVFYLSTIMPAQSIASHVYAGDWGGPDRHFFYTPTELYAQLATWGAAGRAQYINFRLGLDIGFAVSYAFLLVTITSVALRNAWPGDRRRRCLNLAGLVPMSADLLENALGIALVTAFPTRLSALAWLASVVTAAKWLSLVAAHLVMVYALVAAVRRKWQGETR